MSKFDVSNRLYVVMWVFMAAVMTFAVVAGLNYWSMSEGNYAREITVEGKGSTFAIPDTAKLSFGVHSEAATVDEVVKDNTERMAEVMAVLKDKGIDEKDIKTTGYSLNPNYEWSDQQGSYQDGYYLDQNVQITLKDFEMVGGLIGDVTAVGVDVVGGVQFILEDMDAAKSMAREEAIANAKLKADEIAKSSGLKLGAVINYWEYEDYYSPSPYAEAGMGGVMMDAAVVKEESISPDIAPGQQEIKLNVSLTYRLK